MPMPAWASGSASRAPSRRAKRMAGEPHRAPDRHRAAGEVEPGSRMAQERAQEGGEEVLETEALAEDPGFLEAGACREGLEGLDEAVLAHAFEEAVDRPGPALDERPPPRPDALGPEAQGGGVDAEAPAAVAREAQRLDPPVGMRERHDGVRRAEIDADRDGIRGSGGHREGFRDAHENGEAE